MKISLIYGITAPRLWSALRQNHFRIYPPYVLRTIAHLLIGLLNDLLGHFARKRLDRKISVSSPLQAPLFILGHWRGGTTYLHKLISLDSRYAFANTFQVMHPHTFLLTERWLSPVIGRFLPATRQMDQMPLSLMAPDEDELALNIMTGLSPYMALIFPNIRKAYRQFLTFRDIPDIALQTWKTAFIGFLQAVSIGQTGRLVLKSPPHTARIRVLLDIFPEAQFIHIARDPYRVFQSTLHMHQMWAKYTTPLQRPDLSSISASILYIYQLMYRAYFGDLHLIGDGQLHEINFEQLEQDPIGQLQQAFTALNLGNIGASRSALEAYCRETSGYQKNSYPPLDKQAVDRINSRWSPYFERWGYAKERT